jgi:hypothetical protein
VSDRIRSLLMRSCRVAEAIAAEQRRTAPSALRLLRLKRLALILACRLQDMRAGLAPSPGPHGAFVPIRVPSAPRRPLSRHLPVRLSRRPTVGQPLMSLPLTSSLDAGIP